MARITGKLLLILLCAVGPLISCTPVPCFEETEAMVKTTFYSDLAKKMLAPDSLTIYGIGSDAGTLYNKSAKITQALLPLNTSASSCRMVVRINGVTDTLELRYSSYPHLVSKECGYFFWHELDTVTHTTHKIVYIYLAKKNVSTVNEENIRIYY